MLQEAATWKWKWKLKVSSTSRHNCTHSYWKRNSSILGSNFSQQSTFQEDKRVAHATCYLCNMLIIKEWHFDRGTVWGIIPMPKLAKGSIPTSEQPPSILKPIKNKPKGNNNYFQLSRENVPQNPLYFTNRECTPDYLKQNRSGSNQQRHWLWGNRPRMLQA